MSEESSNMFEESSPSILTVSSLPSWLSSLTPITGGNINYAFLVSTGPPPSPSFFVKQAPSYVAFFGPDAGYPLTPDRLRLEIDAYKEFSSVLGPENASRFLPAVHTFDKSNNAAVMEFLEGYSLLDAELVSDKGRMNSAVASGLGEFIGKIHANTHSSVVKKGRRAYLAKHFQNKAMREIQLEFIFTRCYRDTTEEDREGLVVDDEFMNEVEELKAAYQGEVKAEDGCGYVLSHGDLHPGSVMISQENNSVKASPSPGCRSP